MVKTFLFRFIVASALVLGLGLAACSNAKSKYGAHQLSADFSTRLVPIDWKGALAPVAQGVTRDQCQALLEKALCLTNASGDDIADDWTGIQCLSGAETYVQTALRLFDEMPPRLQPLFCSVNRLFVSPNIESTASATALYDQSGKVAGGYVTFREETFTNQPSSHDLVTWKEQLAFGGSTRFLANDPQLVQISYNLHLQSLPKDGLFYVLVHELGHLVDFNNGISSCHATGGCRFGDWVGIAWRSTSTPLASVEYRDQALFCFYDCGGQTLDASQAFDIYGSLGVSGFPTTYSGMNEYEDFAENWAWYLMREFKEPDYEITVPGRGTFNMNPAFTSSPVIAQKQAFMGVLWNSPALIMTNGPQ